MYINSMSWVAVRVLKVLRRQAAEGVGQREAMGLEAVKWPG